MFECSQSIKIGTSSGSLFQAFITRSQKNEARTPVVCFLYSLYWCPLVLETLLRTKNIYINVYQSKDYFVTPYKIGMQQAQLDTIKI